MKVKACYITNVGKERNNNEDSLLLNELIVSESNMNEVGCQLSKGEKLLYIVADGMGGYEKGELASKTALSIFKENYSHIEDTNDIASIISLAKIELNAIAQSNGNNMGLGTTIAGIFLRDKRAIVFNTGDCRVYRLNSDFLEEMTKDHSLVQELVDNDMISEEEKRSHPQKNVVTAALIGDLNDEVPETYTKKINIRDGQKYFLCSDGVWESMDIDAMEECFLNIDIKSIVSCLFMKTMNNGVKDNLSIMVIEVSNE